MIEKKVFEISLDLCVDYTPEHEQQLAVLTNDVVLRLRDAFGLMCITRVNEVQADERGFYVLVEYMYNSEKVKKNRKQRSLFNTLKGVDVGTIGRKVNNGD